MDLAKVGEVKHLYLPLDHEEAVDRKVNGWLKKGFVILSVKVAEERYQRGERDGKQHPYASSTLVYVLGKPRNQVADAKAHREYTEFAVRVSAKAGAPFPVGADLEEGDHWLRHHLPANDTDNPNNPCCEGSNEPPGK